MKQVQQVEITLGSILKVVGVIFAIFLLRQIFDIITLLLIVGIFVTALDPLVKWLMREGIPRTPAVSIIFLTIFALTTILFSLVLTPLVGEVVAFINRLPDLISSFNQNQHSEGLQGLIQNFSNQISGVANTVTAGLFTAVTSFFGGAVSAVLVAVLTFYILVDAPKNQKTLDYIIPEKYASRIKVVVSKIGDKIGSWVLGQFALSASVALITYIALLILGVPYSLTLAVLAGILEVVPYIGPILAGFAAIIVAYGASGWQLALAVAIFYVILQQLENVFLVPKIMQKALGLSPILIIIAVSVGSKVGGIMGAVLAVPILTAIAVIVQEWPKLTK